jgi:hypothetical protein
VPSGPQTAQQRPCKSQHASNRHAVEDTFRNRSSMALEIFPRLPFHVVAGVVHAGQCGRRRRLWLRRFQIRQVRLQIASRRWRKIGGKPDQRLLHGVKRLGLRHRGRCRRRCIGKGFYSERAKVGAKFD